MTLRTIISHPFTLITSFSLVFISGQNMSNFYFSYLLLGLLYGQFYAIIGGLGIVVVLASHFIFKGTNDNLEASFINLIGAILLIVSLFLFYYTPFFRMSGSFVQMAHMLSLFIFCVLVTCFVIIFPLSQKEIINSELH